VIAKLFHVVDPTSTKSFPAEGFTKFAPDFWVEKGDYKEPARPHRLRVPAPTLALDVYTQSGRETMGTRNLVAKG
jgi:hypothetical protein